MQPIQFYFLSTHAKPTSHSVKQKPVFFVLFCFCFCFVLFCFVFFFLHNQLKQNATGVAAKYNNFHLQSPHFLPRTVSILALIRDPAVCIFLINLLGLLVVPGRGLIQT